MRRAAESRRGTRAAHGTRRMRPAPVRALAFALALLVSMPALADRPCFDWAFEARGTAHVGGDVIGGDVGGAVEVAGDLSPAIPSGSTSSASSADTPLSGVRGGGGGGGGGGELLLVAAVVVVAALPLVIYAVDSEADEATLHRYRCPSFQVGVLGGAMAGAADPNVFVPLTGARLQFAQGVLGAQTTWEGTLDGGRTYGAVDAHLLLRPVPKKHVELGLAVGARRVVFGGAERNGLSVALPHRYALTRIDGRALGLEVEPAVFVGNRGADFRLEGSLVIPAGPTTLRAGGQVYSFDSHVRGAAHAGLAFGF